MGRDGQSVTILGAGIVGICSALSLQARGYSVRIIDMAPAGQATSFGNAGVISPWSIIPHSTPGIWKKLPNLMLRGWRPLSVVPATWPSMIPWGMKFLSHGTEARMRQVADAMSILCNPSIDLYRQHLKGTGHEDIIRNTSYLQIFKRSEHASLDDLGAKIRAEKGARMEIVTGPDLWNLEPALSHEFKAAVVIHDLARSLSPGRMGEVLFKKVRSQGANIINDEIKFVSQSNGQWLLTGKSRTYSCNNLVISAGAWSADLLKGLGIKVPLIAERGYHVHCAQPGIEVNNSILYSEAAVIASSMEGGVRVAGQAEFGPIDAPIDPKRHHRLNAIAQKMFPDINIRNSSIWMGRRPSFPDSIPAIGGVPGKPGLFVNFGHSHHGLMMAPKSGELLAHAIANQPGNEDMSKLSIARFLI